MLKFLKAGERPEPKAILNRMLEDGKCLLTGTKTDLTYVPVDTDTSNILPSNMACVCEEIAKNIMYTSYYEIKSHGFVITLDTPPQFEEHNRKVINGLSSLAVVDGTPARALLDAFERLAEVHVKGIFKISYGDITVDRMQYQGFLLRSLVKEQQNKPHIHLA